MSSTDSPQMLAGVLRPGRRGVTSAEVERAADECLRAGIRPTVERIRERLGSGSPNTVNPLLDAWWKRLGSRLESGPAALHRLPEPIAHVAEVLWHRALEEARQRIAIEDRSAQQTLENKTRNLEVRSHVLTLRESELDHRLQERERTLGLLEQQVRDLLTLLQKEQSSRQASDSHVSRLERQLKTFQSNVAIHKRLTGVNKPARQSKRTTRKKTPARAKHIRKPAKLRQHLRTKIPGKKR